MSYWRILFRAIMVMLAIGMLATAATVGAADPSGQATVNPEKKTGPDTGEKTITTPSGLQYVDFKIGDGPSPKPGETAIVHYTGWFEDGKKFDSSRDRGKPFGFKVGMGQVIKGWDEGVASMKVGGTRRLTVPPELGYGAKGAGKVVPPNARLIFDVELLRVQP